jgi:hypothetical protein
LLVAVAVAVELVTDACPWAVDHGGSTAPLGQCLWSMGQD